MNSISFPSKLKHPFPLKFPFVWSESNQVTDENILASCLEAALKLTDTGFIKQTRMNRLARTKSFFHTKQIKKVSKAG